MDVDAMLLAAFRNQGSRRTRLSADLARNLSKVKALIEHTAEAVLILQAESGKVLAANQSAVLLFEAEESALQRLTFSQLSAPRQNGVAGTKRSTAGGFYKKHSSEVRKG